jgi:hypothetical protein
MDLLGALVGSEMLANVITLLPLPYGGAGLPCNSNETQNTYFAIHFRFYGRKLCLTLPSSASEQPESVF